SSPDEEAPATLSSEVPAALPSVTQRPNWPLESLPANSTSRPKTVKSGSDTLLSTPDKKAPATLSSEVPAAVPSVTQTFSWPFLPLESLPPNSTLSPNTVKPNGAKPAEEAPATLSPEVPAAVPSVTQRLLLPLASGA